MKLVFRLSEKQQDRVKEVVAEHDKDLYQKMRSFTEEIGYWSDGVTKLFPSGNILKFTKKLGELNYIAGNLIYIGDRTDLRANTEIFDTMCFIIGKAWRNTYPTEYEDEHLNLFWYETLTEYYKYRATFDEWANWYINADERVKKLNIPIRFYNTAAAVELLRAGRVKDATDAVGEASIKILLTLLNTEE